MTLSLWLSLISLLVVLHHSHSVLPNYKGCADDVSKSLPYCDTNLSIEERVEWILHNLTLDEKIAMISPNASLGSLCATHTAGKESIGLSPYMWLTETNTNVAAACYNSSSAWPRCPTTFIGPLGMAASFNKTLWNQKGLVLGQEMRAFYNLGWHRHDPNDRIGLTGFGPNINIARDPRFGRTSELPGEDALLSGKYAAEMVRGMQQEDKAGYPLMLAYLKHYTAYSTETNRGHDDYDISVFDLFDSYLPQYEIAFKEGGASGVMCSYNAENGHPSCANGYLLNEVIRKKWGQTHAHVTTDCGAVANLLGPPVNAHSPIEASAWSLMNGTDVEMGTNLWLEHMKEAVQDGLATEEAVTRALARGLYLLFRAGRFDPEAGIEWSKLGKEAINSTFAQQVSREAGLQGMVLLKNDKSLLPLKAGSRIAVVGPMGVNQDLMSDYAGGTGEGGCWPNSDSSCIVTIAQAIKNANTGGTTLVAQGVEVNSNKMDGIPEALDFVRASDVVVLVLGNDRSEEHEGHDRAYINLPGKQENLAMQVLDMGKPTLLIVSNGGAIAIDSIMNECDAIVESFNPAHQTPALADLLFGKENRWGRLPVTVYPRTYTQEQSMTNYDMSSGPGRTYKYYPSTESRSRPLFEFGYGLSLTSFGLTCVSARHKGDLFSCECFVKNTGKLDGDAIVLVYHSVGPEIRKAVDHPVPRKRLVDFSRVSVPFGDVAKIMLELPREEVLFLVNGSGDKVVYPGAHLLLFDLGDGSVPVEIQVTVVDSVANDSQAHSTVQQELTIS